jgi:hypothetical protein
MIPETSHKGFCHRLSPLSLKWLGAQAPETIIKKKLINTAGNQPRRFKWPLCASLQEVHSVPLPNGRQSAEKVSSGRCVAAFEKSIRFPPQMAGNQPRRFARLPPERPPLRSPFGFPPELPAISREGFARLPPARLPSRSPFGFPRKWPAISQEGIKWPLCARL